MSTFKQQIKRIKYSQSEIETFNVTTPYLFASNYLKIYKNNVQTTFNVLFEYINKINTPENNKVLVDINQDNNLKIQFNNIVNKLNVEVREVYRKDFLEAYVVIESLLHDFSSKISFIILAGEEHGGTQPFSENIKNIGSKSNLILGQKITNGVTFGDFLKDSTNIIHLIKYNPQDLKMNAFYWSYLYHETFHIIDNETNLIDDNIEMEDTIGKNKEIIIDLLSTIYCGPPYAYSLLQLLEENPSSYAISHLQSVERLILIEKCLIEMQKEYRLKYDEKIDKYGQESGDFEIILLDTFDKIINSIKDSHIQQNNDDERDKTDFDYITTNFVKLYATAKKILKNKSIINFVDRINRDDTELETTSMNIKKVSNFNSMLIPTTVHPVILFNALLNFYIQKEKYTTDERIRFFWEYKNENEINNQILDVLSNSLRKWWAVKEFNEHYHKQ